ncbi:MAG TPA: MutH/Sau3AI family endonuclease [Candidatus Binataceae bacterium]|nr:MutH/Sau3AI family endonuclease [Candidatus Binataceae bacterium]
MDRSEALALLGKLIGSDLVGLGNKHGVTIWKGTRINKGWAGHTIERHLGLPLNSSRSPNFGSWELKVVPVRAMPDGTFKVKETMAITMIDPVEVAAKEFPNSHLYLKLQRMLIVARIFESKAESRSLCHLIAEFDLGDQALYHQIKADYDLIRDVIRTNGFDHLSGSMGVMVQPRTKGPGHGSRSRAFYARTALVATILGIGVR